MILLRILEGRLPQDFKEWSPLAKAQWLETTVFMSGYLLSSQGDRMAMANSVEGRYPFLDYRVIEFCSSLPSDFKLKGLNEKYLAEKAHERQDPGKHFKASKTTIPCSHQQCFPGKRQTGICEQKCYQKAIPRKQEFLIMNLLSAMLGKIEKTGTASEMDNMVLTAVISTHLLYHQFIENQ